MDTRAFWGRSNIATIAAVWANPAFSSHPTAVDSRRALRSPRAGVDGAPRARLRRLPPQPLARNRRAFAQRLQLRPDNAVHHHRVAAHGGAEAAVDAGDHA